jgi:hypothetical protein
LRVGVDGVSIEDSTPGLIDGFSVDIELHGGRFYATSGRVIDPEGLVIEGSYAIPSPPGAQLVEVDDDAGVAYFLSGSRLLSFDRDSLAPVAEPFPIVPLMGTPSRLIKWGTDGLAFRTSQNELHFLRPPFSDETNNQFDHARVIPSVPYGENLDTRAATPAFDDPFCVGQGATVWYAITPTENMTLEANTMGTNYMATLSVYTGTRGALTHWLQRQSDCGPRLTAAATTTSWSAHWAAATSSSRSSGRSTRTETESGTRETTVPRHPDQLDSDFDTRRPCDNCPGSPIRVKRTATATGRERL